MKQRAGNKLPNNLPQLQNLIKRDPLSYKDEFNLQRHYYESLLQAFRLRPTEHNKELDELVMFLAQVSHCYEEEMKQFPQDMVDLLKNYNTQLDPEMRMTFCRALILLRNKGLLQPTDLLELFFNLLRCQDKSLRVFLKNHIIQDIKNTNAKRKDAKLNSTLQNFMFTMLKDSNLVAAKTSLDVMITLYKKNIWNDAKTVNAIATACFHKATKMLATALNFFLGSDEEAKNEDSSSESEPEGPSIQEIIMAHRVNKKSRKRKRILDKSKQAKKKQKKDHKAQVFNFSALHLIHDPQSMAEKLLKSLQEMNEKFEVKLLVMNLISRLIGIHELFVFNYYPLVQRYLQPHQREVTKILQYTAQASHELVPPDVLEPVLMAIANNFVTERNSVEVMTVGLNAIREVCARCPLVMNGDLLHDLAQYKSYRDKNVSTAAKSLIHLYRTINPEMLARKFRGKPTEETQELKALKYGEFKAPSFVPGAEVLDVDGEEENNDEENESDNEDEDDSDGWVDVQHSDDEAPDPEPAHDEKTEQGAEAAMKKGKPLLNLEERAQKAALVSETRILSQQEFAKVRAAQLSKKMKAAIPQRFTKKGATTAKNAATAATTEVTDTTIGEKKEIVSLRDIEKLVKNPRSTKESRLASIKEGREDREKFGGRKKKKGEFASQSNKEKRKTKVFNMVKHKLKRKQKRSFREKQIALRDALLKQKRRK
ncbi:protein SDA1 homolog [Rhipicephalus sanguineus]|uniref:protein SDA1 homolog n=1 Tax=Rhipicephalus sanguineus TaxID=34632 RepID=UPI001894A99F|nr:protein SDA1 homolog [Rhipicephalus sanguineus]